MNIKNDKIDIDSLTEVLEKALSHLEKLTEQNKNLQEKLDIYEKLVK